jgi:hypothetical protein
MEWLKKVYLHPFFIGIYPLLYLYQANITQVAFRVVYRPVLVSLVLAIVVFALARLMLGNWSKAALLSSLGLAWFYSYGHLLHSLRQVSIAGEVLGRNRYLAPVFFLILVFMVWHIWRTKRPLGNLHQLLNFVSVCLILLSVFQIGYYFIRTSTASASILLKGDLPQADATVKQDVYLIVLDGYARADVMQSRLGFDNSDFIRQLESLGFFVVPCSRSNYNSTDLSMGSLLNMNYLQALASDFSPDGQGRYQIMALNKNSLAMRHLQQSGYEVYAFDTGYDITSWATADHFYSFDENNLSSANFHTFEAMYIKTTALNILMDAISLYGQSLMQDLKFPYTTHIEQTLFDLEKLPELAEIKGSKFVFAHILLPHKPYIFTADGTIQSDTAFYQDDGDPLDKDHFIQGYNAQVQFANSRMIPILQTIIEQSSIPPIIILIGDHGYYWGYTNHYNLLALYLPEDGVQGLPPNLSNVNIFRLVFDRYFGTSFGMLPNLSYDLDSSTGVFTQVDERMPGCASP